MPKHKLKTNVIYCGDNLEMLKDIPDESIDLIYIDPPFFSNKHYEVVFGDEAEIRSFEDRWEGGINVYVEWIKERIVEMYRVLKPTGSFYLHCDWHADAYLRVMLDEIFSYENFLNEIIWAYKRWPAKSKNYQRFHDTILFYAKNKGLQTFNTEFQDIADITKKIHGGKKQKALVVDGHRWSKDSDELTTGTPIGDDWYISTIAGNARERLGYPTQKPEALLERIIKVSSNKGDVVLDAFCGCGTSVAVAQQLGRRWIGIDISPTAVKLVERRLQNLGAIKNKDYETVNTPTTDNDLKVFKPFEFQNWVIEELGAKNSKTKSGDFGLDGYFTKDLWHEKAGVQVKQSDGVGRNVVDNFETALKRANHHKGYIVAFSFSKGAYEEAARVKKDETN